MCLEPRGWSIALLSTIVTLSLTTACTKRNPDLCCATNAECTTIGFSSHAPCDLGVCVKNECTITPGVCDDDGDCASDTAAPFCVAGTCAACATSASCPTNDPVCDAVAHDCRACVKDSECDSLACDLAAGTCIDQAAVLYASPEGDDAASCTRGDPCSFAKASTTVDANHIYVALLPGTYESDPTFENQTAIVCGNNASIDANFARIDVEKNSNVTIRDLNAIQDGTRTDDHVVILSSESDLTLVNIKSKTTTAFALEAFDGGTLTIRNSVFQSAGNISLDGGTTIIDRCLFLDGAPITQEFSFESLTITNSLFVHPDGFTSLRIHSASDTTSTGDAFIYNNTFVGGALDCGGDQLYVRSFQQNIFFGVEGFPAVKGCNYDNNIFTPSLPTTGTGNTLADPLFVDSASNDFHLKAGSPAIDAFPDSLTNHDFDGTPRPQGSRNDVGAFEYVLPSSKRWAASQ